MCVDLHLYGLWLGEHPANTREQHFISLCNTDTPGASQQRAPYHPFSLSLSQAINLAWVHIGLL